MTQRLAARVNWRQCLCQCYMVLLSDVVWTIASTALLLQRHMLRRQHCQRLKSGLNRHALASLKPEHLKQSLCTRQGR